MIIRLSLLINIFNVKVFSANTFIKMSSDPATEDPESHHSLGLSWSGGMIPENISKSKWMVPLNASTGGYSKRSASMYTGIYIICKFACGLPG
jgi:hypothetical protein